MKIYIFLRPTSPTSKKKQNKNKKSGGNHILLSCARPNRPKPDLSRSITDTNVRREVLFWKVHSPRHGRHLYLLFAAEQMSENGPSGSEGRSTWYMVDE